MNKLDKLKAYIPKHQNGAKLEQIELTDTPNVLPTGDLHAHKHEDFGIDVTKKGIPVITVKDDTVETLPEIQAQSNSVVQHAEVEKEEIIFNKELTEKIEDLRKKWNESHDDDLAYQAGLILTKEILFNTNDNDNLINKVSQKLENGGIIIGKEGIAIFNKDNLRNTFSAYFSDDQINNMNNFYNYFSNKGWSDNQIFALMGNIMQESQFNPGLTNKYGAYGYYQFKNDRLKDYYKWRDKNGMKEGGLTQTLYLDYILQNGIDPRYDYYVRLQNNINNNIDVEKSKQELNKFKTKYWIKDLNTIWRDPNSTLKQLVEGFGNTIEAAGSELNLPQRLKYALGFQSIRSKIK